jgi:hypothetical protein
MRKKLSLAMFATVFLIFAQSSRANLIINGGFETGDATGWTTSNLNAAYSGVFLAPLNNISAHSGDYLASLSNYSFEGFAEFSQTATTDVGQLYNLSFWVYIQPSDPEIQFRALWNNTLLLDIHNPPSNDPDQWVNYQFLVVGTGSDTVLFQGINDPAFNGLDDVSLTAVPEPASALLLGVGAGLGVTVYRLRRRSKAAA